MTPSRQTLDADELQLVLDSAGNASKNGRNQFFTPEAVATALMLPLPPRHARMLAVDLQCGEGSLLRASGAAQYIGCDIDPKAVSFTAARSKGDTSSRYLTADCTLLAPLLHETGCRFDLAFANPPFSMQWHRERLAFLSDSDLPAVASAFPKGGDTVDSTLATLCLLLDRLTRSGEGMMLCNASTAERLFASSPLRNHIWLWLTLPAGVFPGTRDLETAVLYFARDHVAGPLPSSIFRLPSANADDMARYLAPYASQRSILRRGLACHGAHSCDHEATLRLWHAATSEYKERHGGRPNKDFNLWLGKDGLIRRHLTPFQSVSTRIPRDDAKMLDKLQGESPMSLVVQKPTRLALQRAVRSPYWRVCPQLIAEVERALHEYNACRAPFYPPNDIQRLGWLDEEDSVECISDLRLKISDLEEGEVIFRAGQSYELRTFTVDTARRVTRQNILGEPQDCTLHGKELMIAVKAADGTEHTFGESDQPGVLRWPVFLAHFRLPEVADVAQLHPERYAAHLAWLEDFEKTIKPSTK